MSPILIAIAFVSDPSGIAHEIELDAIRLEQAWAVKGKRVRSTFTISCRADLHVETTIIGVGHDDIERTAFIPKNLCSTRGKM